MSELQNIVKSFDVHNQLNQNIWDSKKNKMNPKVRENLLQISEQFIDTFGVDVIIDDILVVGSIANYNWSKYSDIDLHILIDYKQFPKNLKSMYVEFFDLKKIVFNDKRDVKIFGFDVECFVEDVDTRGVSGGEYSILTDEWVKRPKKLDLELDKDLIIKQSKKWMRLIDNLLKNLSDESPDEIEKQIKRVKSKLKKFRLSGLKKGGEMSVENIIFKVLRRNGYITKLYEAPIKIIDRKLSIDNL